MSWAPYRLPLTLLTCGGRRARGDRGRLRRHRAQPAGRRHARPAHVRPARVRRRCRDRRLRRRLARSRAGDRSGAVAETPAARLRRARLAAAIALRGFGFSDSLIWPAALCGAGILLARGRSGAAVVAGLSLVAVGVVVFVDQNATGDGRDAAFQSSAVAIALLLVLGPWAWRLAAERNAERIARIRFEERAEMAARIHDSVLQTLALVQRESSDPRASPRSPGGRSASSAAGCIPTPRRGREPRRRGRGGRRRGRGASRRPGRARPHRRRAARRPGRSARACRARGDGERRRALRGRGGVRLRRRRRRRDRGLRPRPRQGFRREQGRRSASTASPSRSAAGWPVRAEPPR